MIYCKQVFANASFYDSVNLNWKYAFPKSKIEHCDRLCGLVVRVPGYRSRGPGSIPDTTSFSEK
jgi:hypothetical protein